MATLTTTVTPQGVMTQGTIEIVLDKSNNRITVDSMFKDNGYVLGNHNTLRDVLSSGGVRLYNQVRSYLTPKDGKPMWWLTRARKGFNRKVTYKHSSPVTVEYDERYVRVHINYSYWQEEGKWYLSSNALNCEKVRLDSIECIDNTSIPVTTENVHQAALYALGYELYGLQLVNPDIFKLDVDMGYTVLILRCNKLIRYEILTALAEFGFSREHGNLEWTDCDNGTDDTHSERLTVMNIRKDGYEVLDRYVEYFRDNGVDEYDLSVTVVPIPKFCSTENL